MIPQSVRTISAEELASRWMLELELAERIKSADDAAGDIGPLLIVSGFRSCREQGDLLRDGKTPLHCCDCTPENDPCSTHTTDPATGADLWTAVTPVIAVRARFGQVVTFAGLRWGGGSSIDPESGIPSDWNHVDLGPVQGRVPC